MATSSSVQTYTTLASLDSIFEQQKKDFDANPFSSLEQRVSQLKALKSAVLKHKTDLVDAMSRDFGHRSNNDSLIGDIFPVVSQINYTVKHLKKWIKPSKRHAGLLLAPAKVRVEYQAKGVVGIIAPWNFPIMLSLSPLVTSIAAGNRTMIKLSEFTPETNTVVASLIRSVFPLEQVAIIEGEVDIASAFTALAFDHLLFTGSTQVGKQVMRAAADNLTPVTLELGGKSPAIIADDMPMHTAVERLIYGKCLNAGQICVSPDYVLCPSKKVDQFIQAYRSKFQSLYPNFDNNNDYSQIINERQAQRLAHVLQDARAKGATVFPANINTVQEETDIDLNTETKKWPTQIITHVNADMLVMQQEIFGPLLPVVPYDSLDDAIAFVKANPRPLALYLMSYNNDVQTQVLQQTHSGGICINETVFHVAAEDAPFGGIGDSGMGHYHGIEGFKTLSHAKTILQRGTFNSGKFIHPPYRGLMQRLILAFFMR